MNYGGMDLRAPRVQMGYAYDGDLDLGFGNYARRGERWVQVRGAPLTVSDGTVKTSRAVARSLPEDALGNEQVVLRHLLDRYTSIVVCIHHRKIARHCQAFKGRIGWGGGEVEVEVGFGGGSRWGSSRVDYPVFRGKRSNMSRQCAHQTCYATEGGDSLDRHIIRSP